MSRNFCKIQPYELHKNHLFVKLLHGSRLNTTRTLLKHFFFANVPRIKKTYKLHNSQIQNINSLLWLKSIMQILEMGHKFIHSTCHGRIKLGPKCMFVKFHLYSRLTKRCHSTFLLFTDMVHSDRQNCGVLKASSPTYGRCWRSWLMQHICTHLDIWKQ